MEYVVTKENPFFKEGLIIKMHGTQTYLATSPNGIMQEIYINEVAYLNDGWIKKVEKPILTKSEAVKLIKEYDQHNRLADEIDIPDLIDYFCRKYSIECE